MQKLQSSALVDVDVADPSNIDPSVILGHLSGRELENLTLRIGAGAHLRSGTVIYAGTTIGAGFETGHNVVIREENVIGDQFRIWNNSTVDYGCQIGDRVRIHNNVYVAQYTTIEDDVFIAPGVMLANDPHPVCGLCMRGPTIKSGARIGINATILSHITIGENALIGAGSVVTKDIPANTLAMGNPAVSVKSVDELPCPYELVDQPYIRGVDVETRNRKGMH